MPGLKEARTRYPRFGGGFGIPRPFRALARSNSHCGQGPAETGGFCASDLQTGLISWLKSGLGVALVEPWWSLGGALVEPWGGLGVALGWLCTPESMPSIWLCGGLSVALGGFGVARADSFSILRILTPVSHPQSVEARRGHGHYAEDAKPKCSFLTAFLPCLFSQMRKPPPKLPSSQACRRGWLKTDTGGTPIRYRSNTGAIPE